MDGTVTDDAARPERSLLAPRNVVIVGASERSAWSAGSFANFERLGFEGKVHLVSPEGARILTVQDHPLHTSNASLVWQEDIEKGEILILGSQAGFETNIADYAAR